MPLFKLIKTLRSAQDRYKTKDPLIALSYPNPEAKAATTTISLRGTASRLSIKMAAKTETEQPNTETIVYLSHPNSQQ